MVKVLVATDKPFASVAIDSIRKIVEESGFEFILLEKYKDAADLLKAVAEVDALIVRSDLVTREVMEAGKNLKIVVRAGTGVDNIDLVAATEHHLVVMNTPGQNSNAVAELTLGMMVYMARGMFNGKSGSELMGKTLGLYAFGNVGKRVAVIARGFGMEVFAYDPNVSNDVFEKMGATRLSSMEELFSRCQYVSLHVPATAETKNSINYELLSKMPAGAVLVNTARKEVVNETDLLRFFADRSDFVYIADVTPDCSAEIQEKYAGRFFFTPKKMGAQTEEANINAGIAAAKQIKDFFEKGDVTFKVNK
ncbi:MAG: NAD(P)-dependent oxidoreductase [Anaerolineaceae bacterium]